MSNGETTELAPITVVGAAPPKNFGLTSLSGLLVFHTVIQILYAPNSAAETEVGPAGEFKDITNIMPPMHLVNFRYEDHISFQADELEIIFPDTQDLIVKDTKEGGVAADIGGEAGFKKGGWLKVKIHQWNADYPGSHTVADPGSFQIDQMKQMGPPTQATLMATSVPISSTIKLTQKSNISIGDWTLQRLAQRVADENGLKLIWEVRSDKGNQFITGTEQHNETDFAMLSRVLHGRALDMKIRERDGQQCLIVFDRQELEKNPPVYTVDFGDRSLFVGLANIFGSTRTKGITHWEFTTQSQDIYSLATISIIDAYTGRKIVGTTEAAKDTADGIKEKLNEHELSSSPSTKVEGEDIAQGD